jgi:hypothetical protein
MTTKRQHERRILIAVLTLIIAGCIAAAFFFGETSPVIAEGKILLKPEMEAQAQGMRTVYIIVKDPSSPMPMPYGAMATTISEDPKGTVMTFKLTRDNLRVMNTSAEHPQKIIVKARLDMDGMGGADTPGDIVGTTEAIDWGAKGITLTLDQLITGAGDSASDAQAEPGTP